MTHEEIQKMDDVALNIKLISVLAMNEIVTLRKDYCQSLDALQQAETRLSKGILGKYCIKISEEQNKLISADDMTEYGEKINCYLQLANEDTSLIISSSLVGSIHILTSTPRQRAEALLLTLVKERDESR